MRIVSGSIPVSCIICGEFSPEKYVEVNRFDILCDKCARKIVELYAPKEESKEVRRVLK